MDANKKSSVHESGKILVLVMEKLKVIPYMFGISQYLGYSKHGKDENYESF